MSRPDLDALLDALVPFAKCMIVEYGGFFPFGGTISEAGKFEAVISYTGPDVPVNAEVLASLEAGLRMRAQISVIRAAAICSDGYFQVPGTTQATSAIQVRLEHQDGETFTVYVPYGRSWFGRLKYGEPFTKPATPTLFPR
jgi:hypothetical protein